MLHTCLTHIPPSLCPTSTASSILFPATYAPKNPPAKASPAPLVSTISSSFKESTGKIFASDLGPTTRQVSLEPCVKTTTRSRDLLDFSYPARDFAIPVRSVLGPG